MINKHKAHYESPIGLIRIVGTDDGIMSLDFVEARSTEPSSIHPCLRKALDQIEEYFRGKRRTFSLELVLEGTRFQERVWKELMRIPFGVTASYRDVAESIGNRKATRAVGNANGKNKIAIIIPCHRVIGSDGSLTGYASGVWRKKWLLEHERDVASKKMVTV
jgi:methylated-DNA-[protein]-cysteine S-methyltransferase